MLLRNDRPSHQAHHLLDNDFDPDLKHGQLLGDTVDDGVPCRHVIQVGLMEHEWVMVKAEKMARVGGFFDGQQVIPITRGSRSVGVDPFKDRTGRKLALR